MFLNFSLELRGRPISQIQTSAMRLLPFGELQTSQIHRISCISFLRQDIFLYKISQQSSCTPFFYIQQIRNYGSRTLTIFLNIIYNYLLLIRQYRNAGSCRIAGLCRIRCAVQVLLCVILLSHFPSLSNRLIIFKINSKSSSSSFDSSLIVVSSSAELLDDVSKNCAGVRLK